jgi:CheY-like chemotaxis protein
MPMPRLILIVDDEAGIRDSIAALLVDEGYRVHTATDGREALTLLTDPPPTDVVVSDVMMPHLDGYGLVEAMRKRQDATPVILISAGPLPVCGEPHVTCLQKPFDVEELLAEIVAALRD